MSEEHDSLHEGDRWEIWLTGSPVKHEAIVLETDPPQLRLCGRTPAESMLLKDGDFILLRRVAP